MDSAHGLLGFLFSPQGKIGRGAFLLAGMLLAAFKLAADYALAHYVFHRVWDPIEYIWSKSLLVRLSEQQPLRFYFAMLCLATPFAWIGVCLCAKRLRSANAPTWLVIFFFVPLIKWFLFTLLSILPPRAAQAPSPGVIFDNGILKWFPQTAAASATVAVLITGVVGTALVLISVNFFHAYGSTLFLGVPFYVGFLTTLLYGLRTRRTFLQSFVAALISLLFLGAILLAIATEGIVCLAMAAPLAFWEALIGCWIAHGLLATARHSPVSTMLSIMLVFPALIGTESLQIAPTSVRSVTSDIRIDAPPQTVWPHVISFAEIPPPKEWIFRAGIAYPQRARIDGVGVGAVRHCIFSTGEFVEPITAWEEPSRLAFDVSEQPDPLTELSPFQNLRAPHLRGYFESKQGEFQLIRTTEDGTLLRGTTWYAQKFEPNLYWNFWSDFMIHRIHMRVLRHIKSETERNRRKVAANCRPVVATLDVCASIR